MDYSILIDEAYAMKREAALVCADGDAAKATELLDGDMELELSLMHLRWAEVEFVAAKDAKVRRFFGGMQGVLHEEWRDQDSKKTVQIVIRSYLKENNSYGEMATVRPLDLNLSPVNLIGKD